MTRKTDGRFYWEKVNEETAFYVWSRGEQVVVCRRGGEPFSCWGTTIKLNSLDSLRERYPGKSDRELFDANILLCGEMRDLYVKEERV